VAPPPAIIDAGRGPAYANGVNDLKLDAGTVVTGLPIFPLPHIAFFPNTLLPLHVFEPRYMAMLDDVWEGDRLLGIVQLRQGWEEAYHAAPGVHSVLGIGRVLHRSEAPEHRANILVRGLCRARILSEEVGDLPYRSVTVEVLDSDCSDTLETAHRLATVRHLFSGLLAGLDGIHTAGAEALFSPDADPSVVVDAIASALPIEAEAKQDLLAELDVPRRADHLSEILIDLASAGWTPSDFSPPS